jgi:hypothetical protein
MKIWIKGALLLVIVAAVLTACSPFVFTSSGLKGKTLTYYMGFDPQVTTPFTSGSYYPTGHDNTVLTFDNTGTAGTFTTQTFTFNFPTAAAVTSGNYTDKTWYQVDGWQGTFTYDPKTMILAATYTKEYAPTSGAAALSTGYFAQSDYSYQDLKTVENMSAYSETDTMSMLITQDNLNAVYSAGTAADSWVSTNSTNVTSTPTGSTTATTIDKTDPTTFTVSSGTIVANEHKVTTTTVGSGTPSTTTMDTTTTYSISKYFLVGGDTGTKSFTDVWKKKNTVSFAGDQTKLVDIGYTGSTAPTAPTPSTSTGKGLTGGPWVSPNSSSNTMPYYYIDNGTYPALSPAQVTFTNMGDYIYQSLYAAFAYRHISK